MLQNYKKKKTVLLYETLNVANVSKSFNFSLMNKYYQNVVFSYF